MAELGGFDASQYETKAGGGDFEPLPTGWYSATITGSEMRDTRAGDGEYLKVEWTIFDGEFEGRKVWQNVNLKNPNPKAVAIGNEQLAAICKAVGVIKPNDSEELHDKVCKIQVKIRPAKDGYPASNDVKNAAPVDNGVAVSKKKEPVGSKDDSSVPF